MARIPLPEFDTMTPDQRAVADAILAGPRRAMIGPLRAALLNPELCERWQRFGEVLRFPSHVPKRLAELAIVVTGCRWNAQLEFHVHAAEALAAGLEPQALEAMRLGNAPCFTQADDCTVYEFARHLLLHGRVPDHIYRSTLAALGTVGIVELTALIGYYSMVAMTLNAHELPLPDAVMPPLPQRDSLVDLPAATWHQPQATPGIIL